MSILTSRKWILVAGVLLALVVLAVVGKKSVKAELVVAAAPEEVWRLITAGAEYRSWNPVLVPLEGNIALGDQVMYELTDNKGNKSTISARVKAFEAPRYLNQFGGIPGIITFNHEYILEPTDGGTRIIQQEEYRGLYIWFWDHEWLNGAYASVNKAIRRKIGE